MKNIFRVPDLRNKVLFTLLIIALYQIGANVPSPASTSSSRSRRSKRGLAVAGVLGFLNLFWAAALLRMAVFGLGIMPYITSSIIIQLLSTVIPKLEEWRDQGAVGQKKLTQTTRYLTVGLALHAVDRPRLRLPQRRRRPARHQERRPDPELHAVAGPASSCLTLTAGTAFVMWLAELITQRGIGQGMSILIFANVVAGIPAGGNAVLDRGRQGSSSGSSSLVSLVLLVLIVFMDQGQRRIPVTFAKRVVGRRMYGGSARPTSR